MNCSKCQYLQQMTKNQSSRCFIHGMTALLGKFERKQLVLTPAEINKLKQSRRK